MADSLPIDDATDLEFIGCKNRKTGPTSQRGYYYTWKHPDTGAIHESSYHDVLESQGIKWLVELHTQAPAFECHSAIKAAMARKHSSSHTKKKQPRAVSVELGKDDDDNENDDDHLPAQDQQQQQQQQQLFDFSMQEEGLNQPVMRDHNQHQHHDMQLDLPDAMDSLIGSVQNHVRGASMEQHNDREEEEEPQLPDMQVSSSPSPAHHQPQQHAQVVYPTLVTSSSSSSPPPVVSGVLPGSSGTPAANSSSLMTALSSPPPANAVGYSSPTPARPAQVSTVQPGGIGKRLFGNKAQQSSSGLFSSLNPFASSSSSPSCPPPPQTMQKAGMNTGTGTGNNINIGTGTGTSHPATTTTAIRKNTHTPGPIRTTTKKASTCTATPLMPGTRSSLPHRGLASAPAAGTGSHTGPGIITSQAQTPSSQGFPIAIMPRRNNTNYPHSTLGPDFSSPSMLSPSSPSPFLLSSPTPSAPSWSSSHPINTSVNTDIHAYTITDDEIHQLQADMARLENGKRYTEPW